MHIYIYIIMIFLYKQLNSGEQTETKEPWIQPVAGDMSHL